MKDKRYGDYLQDILEHIDAIEEFTADISLEDFRKDRRTIFAVIRGIEVIGEASKHISHSLRSQYPNIPWREMAGMRDKVIHGYSEVDLDVVWMAATIELPEIRPQIEMILKSLEDKSEI